MTNPHDPNEQKGLRSHPWRLSYKTSSTMIDGRPVNILHDFYIPALKLAVRYDRVAGYFRSSSLAAASQGFSSFVQRNGKMRLIVGADLAPEDVKAILAGDAKRLEARLNDELKQFESWPESVQNGVSLLSWMVAHGYLEVRVAFRLHKETGEPLPFDSVEDGYVHEKWFIMYDEYGNRIYGSGSLNESKNALVLNAENIDIHCDWKGETEKERVDQAVEDFENLWHGKLPHMPVLTLPEAVRRRMLQIAEGITIPKEVDGTPVANMPVEDTPSVLERLQFAILRDGPKMPNGRFVGMETAPVEPWPHQQVVVRRLVETWPYSYLLCDEVGLGKTIEAGLAFRSLYLSGLAKRILIAAPASLTKQWQRQMATKMLMSFGRAVTTPDLAHEYEFPHEEQRPASSIYEPDLVIVSTGLLPRRERVEELKNAQSFDVALVDEAHAARRHNPSRGASAHPEYGQLYTTLQSALRENTRCLWLATATPMQIHPVEVCDLLALTNRVGVFQFDPTLILEYYQTLEKLLNEQELSEWEWTFLRRAILGIREQDPMLWRYFEQYVIDNRNRHTIRRWLENGYVPRGVERQFLLRIIFSGAPLSRVMLRHTRKLLEVYREYGRLQQNLAERHILPMEPIAFNDLEKRIYAQLETYCKGLMAQIQKHGNSQHRQMVNFYLSFLRLRFASSLYALRETLKRRLDKVEATLKHHFDWKTNEDEINSFSLNEVVYEGDNEDDVEVFQVLLQGRSMPDLEWERNQIQKMLQQLNDLTGDSSKMKVLLEQLERRKDQSTGRIRQTVVFTRFYDTLLDIVSRLRRVDQHMRIGTYSGKGAEYFDPDQKQMIPCDREEVKERFLRGEIDVLVCTDAAAEGLNLQTADLLINYDLGWNPMKIEQRIGRIDRIGQKHQHIYVLNLFYAGSAEEIVYRRLLERLQKANLIVGTQQISLLPVKPDEFRQLEEGTLTEEELYIISTNRLKEQLQHHARMEIPAHELFEIYQHFTDNTQHPSAPVTMEAIWETLSTSRYLKSRGCTKKTVAGEEILEIRGIPGVPDGTVLTASRKLYDEGLTDGKQRVHFASYGDPYFEKILEHIQNYELPSCVRRITIPVEGMNGVDRVGYAVVCRGTDGIRQVRLIQSWDDLKHISLNEDEEISEQEIKPLFDQLRSLVRKELEPNLAAERIERENIRIALVQELLNFLIIRDLLQTKAGEDGDQAVFGTVIKAVESTINERERILITNIPIRILSSFQRHLVYDVTIPSIGEYCHIQVPQFAAKAAADAGRRVAESLKRNKSELTIKRVVARLNREAEQRTRLVVQ